MGHGAKGKGQSVTKLMEINPYLSQRKHPPKADIAQREGVLRDTERSVSSVRISFAKARGNFFYKNDFYQNGHALKRDPVYHSITPSLNAPCLSLDNNRINLILPDQQVERRNHVRFHFLVFRQFGIDPLCHFILHR